MTKKVALDLVDFIKMLDIREFTWHLKIHPWKRKFSLETIFRKPIISRLQLLVFGNVISYLLGTMGLTKFTHRSGRHQNWIHPLPSDVPSDVGLSQIGIVTLLFSQLMDQVPPWKEMEILWQASKWAKNQKNILLSSYFPFYWLFNRDPYNVFFVPYITG